MKKTIVLVLLVVFMVMLLASCDPTAEIDRKIEIAEQRVEELNSKYGGALVSYKLAGTVSAEEVLALKFQLEEAKDELEALKSERKEILSKQ